MKKMLLASTSRIYGQKYLEYLLEDIKILFSGCEKIIFIPYARPSGISHLEYTNKAKKVFESLNLNILDYTCLLYTSPSPRDCRLSRMPSSA